MAFGVLMGQIAVIFLEVMLGYAGARCGVITDRDSRFLSDFIMKLLLPCTMLAGAAIDDEPEIVLQAGVLFVLLLALFIATTGICRLVSRVRRDTPGEAAVLVGTAAMPNCGFIGLPLCAALLGSARGTVFATVAMAAYNVWFFTYVVTLFRPGEKLHWKTFVTPANIATVAMLVLLATGWRLPGPVQTFCSTVGGCTTPMALMIVGVMLAGSDLRALLRKGFLYRVTVLRGVVFPLLFLLVLVVSCLFVDPKKLVEKPSPYFRFLLNQFSRLAFDLGGVRVHVTGLEKVPRKGRFLLISNHLFAFDPIVFYYAMPWAELAFISKTENFSLYIVAQVMRKILCLPLDRNNDREALKAILKAIQFIKEDKASIAVFPEGGTSKSGLLQPFRNGAFKIAQKAGVPIVVCALTNTKAILKNMFRRRTDVHLDVLDVIPAETVASLKTTVEIGDYAHKILSEGLAKRGVATAQPS